MTIPNHTMTYVLRMTIWQYIMMHDSFLGQNSLATFLQSRTESMLESEYFLQVPT